MAVKAMTLVGLDVHARQTHAAIVDPDSGELRVSKLRMAPVEVASFLEGLGPGVVAVYEAGPTGFGLARAARERGIDVRVAAPGSIPKGPGDRVKTDRRDAIRLVRLLAAGELSFAFVPTVADEHFRDLVRAIEDARGDLMRARHRLGEVPAAPRRALPRPRSRLDRHAHGAGCAACASRTPARRRRSPTTSPSVELLGGPPRDADRRARPADPRVQPRPGDRPAALLPRHRHAVGRRAVRRGRRLRPLPRAHAAVGLPRDRARPSARPTPSAARARSPRPAPATPAGCWSRPPTTTATSPRSAPTLARRQHGQDPRIIAIAWRAQRRLHQRWQHLHHERAQARRRRRDRRARASSPRSCWEAATLD